MCRKKQAKTHFEIITPIFVGHRKKPKEETYLMQRHPKRYIVGQTSNVSKKHKENIEALAATIRGGQIVNTVGAREFLANRP